MFRTQLSAITASTGLYLITALCASSALSMTAVAAEAMVPQETKTAMMGESASLPLIRMNKRLKGSVKIVEENGQTLIRFSDDFRASNGPDLKIFLSPTALDTVSGTTATNGSVLIGKVTQTKGSHDYVVPEGVILSEFSSVLVHCEAFSVLWGGASLG